MKKSRLLCAVCAVAALVPFNANAVIYDIVNLTEEITYFTNYPSLNDNGQVAYQVNINGYSEIYLDGTEYSAVLPNEIHHRLPSLNNNGSVAWVRNDNQGNYDLMLDGVNLTSNTSDPINSPVINNSGQLAWEQHTVESDIFFEGVNLTANISGGAGHPSLNDNGQVAWSVNGGTNYIYLDGEIIAEGNNEFWVSSPSINNLGQIAWLQRTGPDTTDVFLDGINISQDIPGIAQGAVLNELGQVAWWQIDGANRDIYLDGVNITADYTESAEHPSLNNNGQLVWQMGGDIYLATPIAAIPTLTIVIPDGTPQECTDVGSSTISMNAQITLDNSDALDTVSWVLDGSPVASGESVDILVPLGTHSIEATVTTMLGQSATDTTTIVVEDTVAPAITNAFLDSKTGAVITTIKGKDKAVPSYGISDICDPAPTVVSATVGVPAENADTVSAKTSKKDASVNVSIQGNTETAELTVSAEDASGNISSSKAVLTIIQ